MEKHQAKKHDLVEKEEKSSRFFTIWETYFVGKNHTAKIHDFTFSIATSNITETITF